jgi:hypothetical protein
MLHDSSLYLTKIRHNIKSEVSVGKESNGIPSPSGRESKNFCLQQSESIKPLRIDKKVPPPAP